MAPPGGAKAPRGQPGPSLPNHLLKQLGASDSGPRQGGGGGGGRDRNGPSLSRKDSCKAQRTQQKAQRNNSSRNFAERTATSTAPKRHAVQKAPMKTAGKAPSKHAPAPSARKEIKPATSKQRKPEPELDINLDESESEKSDDGEPLFDLEASESDDDDGMDDGDSDSDSEDMGEDGFDDLDDDDDEEEQEDTPGPKKSAALSKTMKDKLAEDDAEIAALERKLGLKSRNGLPQSFKDDGLGDLLGDLDGGAVDDETIERKKRKAEADDWLAAKRRKATDKAAEEAVRARRLEEKEPKAFESDDTLNSSDFDCDEDVSGFGSDDDEDEDMEDFDGMDSDDDEEAEQKPKERVRENPYVAPAVAQATVKYVPPSMRQQTGSEAELTARIRRQTQGLVNRLTESSMLGILGDVEKLYRDNPRQHVSSTLVDLLLIQVCEPTSLPDTLLILSAGFCTAVYRVIGMDFGAQLIQEVVERFSKHYEDAKVAALERPDVSKQTSNIITFLSELYNFQLIGPSLLFDYIRLLLDDLSELNAELLLRIIRMSGPTLRHDDPMALKDIVTLIRPAVAKIGENNLSVRTKFMIETINDLKNNKMKTGVIASAVNSEHATRMKKLLGTLNSRKLKSTEPLRMSLKDIRDSDKKGKWWLVGASWAGAGAGAGGEKTSDQKNRDKGGKEDQEDDEGDDDDDDDDSVFLNSDGEGAPDLADLAREQQMNTDVRRSIFVSILSATDYEDAYFRILKLRLNKERQREIPNVLIQCTGAEEQYNPYYTLIAKKLCADRKVRWSFQDSLWRLFRRLGESVFGEAGDDEEEDDAMDMRRLVNIAKLFGSLVASGKLGLGVLKCLNLPYLQAKTKAFVEVMLITVLLECETAAQNQNQGAGEAWEGFGREDGVSTVFMAVENIPELARGLQWFLKKVVRKSDLCGGKARKETVREMCAKGVKVLERALTADQGLE
ncbi:hypothetical protein B0T19DRAFT_278498 [Cercophora scortea]|uniref:MI domain-containing protein n=1 Tax=Cercophora scortea TaxID=314031 RepID=A0AAE0I7R6_9PEZI|nr:hypothetical protein B0T19DRAFT_278498 [Cercophora scortea]